VIRLSAGIGLRRLIDFDHDGFLDASRTQSQPCFLPMGFNHQLQRVAQALPAFFQGLPLRNGSRDLLDPSHEPSVATGFDDGVIPLPHADILTMNRPASQGNFSFLFAQPPENDCAKKNKNYRLRRFFRIRKRRISQSAKSTKSSAYSLLTSHSRSDPLRPDSKTRGYADPTSSAPPDRPAATEAH
jgi:hypothetical protein